jgi:hypothetical protein
MWMSFTLALIVNFYNFDFTYCFNCYYFYEICDQKSILDNLIFFVFTVILLKSYSCTTNLKSWGMFGKFLGTLMAKVWRSNCGQSHTIMIASPLLI